tara:strand:- start:350 stop:523 length:174 start_codon:yes stop_codon:yes gene_type:complete
VAEKQPVHDAENVPSSEQKAQDIPSLSNWRILQDDNVVGHDDVRVVVVLVHHLRRVE